MSINTTYTKARANLAGFWDRIIEDHETVIVERRGVAPIAMVAADELAELRETVHLLRSPANARRLLRALERAEKDAEAPQSIDELREELGLDTGLAAKAS